MSEQGRERVKEQCTLESIDAVWLHVFNGVGTRIRWQLDLIELICGCLIHKQPDTTRR
jgi:hypothetical protein